MALVDNCILWNKLGSAGEVTSSEIGQNGAWTGTPTYSACKFGNGSYSNNIGNYILIPDNDFDQDNFIFECWLKLDWSTPEVPPHWWVWWEPDGSNRFSTGLEGGNIYSYWRQNSGGGALNISVAQSITGGDLNHFMLVCNRSGIAGGADTRRIYWNTTLIYNSATALNASTAAAGNIKLLNHITTGGALNGVMDNLKIYNDTTQVTIDAIIANKDNEGWGGGAVATTDKMFLVM